ncbi:MAG TPA: hypothetical protein VKY74_27990 [Chloroflexia bacterium]|nr:hypothetical protein [Chloroflexia bacterium]
MSYWKQILGRLALSTASLAIIAGLGGLLGAICGAILELILQAILGLAVPPLAVVPLFVLLGLALSLIWGLTILVQNWPQRVVTSGGEVVSRQ